MHCSIVAYLLLAAGGLMAGEPRTAFEPGKPWLDTEGKPIQAHSAGIIERHGIYYWYGEDKTLGNGNRMGISCYSSKDLLNWQRLGLALPKTNLPAEFQDRGICERAKVAYNERTGKYVMWMHLDNQKYTVASAGVAISEHPAGPFQFLNHARPIHFDFGFPADDRCQQKELGSTFRDMNLFVDTDDRAYVFYAAEDNRTLYVVRLNGDYTAPESPAQQGRTWARVLVDQSREAPAPFKYRNKYYLITSGCTGWNANAAQFAVANNILGPWQAMGNPCLGEGQETTFRSQSTFVLPAPGQPPGCFIFMADRWEPRRLENSTYVWLPFVIRDDGNFVLNFRERWDMGAFAEEKSPGRAKTELRTREPNQ